MRRTILLLVLLCLIIPFAFGELNYSFVSENGELIYHSEGSEDGLLYFYAPNQVLENSKATVAVFVPKISPGTNPEFNLSLNSQIVINPQIQMLDLEEGYVSFLATWDVSIDSNSTLELEFSVGEEKPYIKNHFIEAKPRQLLDKKFFEETIPVKNADLEEFPNLRKRFSEQGFDFSQEEFNQMRDLAAEKLTLLKHIKTEITYYEGDVVVEKSTSKIIVENEENLELFVVEFIKKDVVESAYDLAYSIEPIILEEDPLIMWHLEEDINPEIAYALEREGENNSVLTGNTILLAKTTQENDNTSAKKLIKILTPIILIPLIGFIIIYFGTVNIKKKK